MCCVTRLALSGTPSTSWNSSKSFCKHMFTLLTVCICFLIRLIGHRGMLVIRSSVVQYRFDDLIGIGIILNFISPSIKSPITPHIIHPVFSAHLDFWQLNGSLVGDGEPSPAAEPWIEGDEKNCWSIVSMDTSCQCGTWLHILLKNSWIVLEVVCLKNSCTFHTVTLLNEKMPNRLRFCNIVLNQAHTIIFCIPGDCWQLSAEKVSSP